jgi:NTE family protein
MKRVLLSLLLIACAHYPHTIPIPTGIPAGRSASWGYRFENFPPSDKNTDSLFVILTFSGGGTRAAAFAYGVLKELAATQIDTGTKARSLLEEVDVISSVSGGSIAGAFYALYGPDSLNAFEARFLTWNAESSLKQRIFSRSLLRLASPAFSRSDVAAETWDRRLFHGATFGLLAQRGKRPYLIINATDVGLNAQFSFTQEQFDPLCADLSRFTIARAVAASSAFPILLTPITLENHAGECGFNLPGWAERDLAEPRSSDQYRAALRYGTYADAKKRPYIHLFDGGPSDNLGVRPVLRSLTSISLDFSLLRLQANGRLTRVVVIIVDARTSDASSIDKKAAAPGLLAVLRAAAGTPFDNFSYESIDRMKFLASLRLYDSRTSYCYKRMLRRLSRDSLFRSDEKSVPLNIVHLTFADVEDTTERQLLLSVPTSFSLPLSTVRRVEDAAAKLLRTNEDFKRLLSELRHQAKPEEISCVE